MFEDIGWHDGSGHGRSGDLSSDMQFRTRSEELGRNLCGVEETTHRCNDVRLDVILDTLFRQGHGESDQTG